MTGIRLNSVDFSFTKGRRRVQVLRQFSLNVGQGEVVALLGESGCGKSTALSLVS